MCSAIINRRDKNDLDMKQNHKQINKKIQLDVVQRISGMLTLKKKKTSQIDNKDFIKRRGKIP